MNTPLRLAMTAAHGGYGSEQVPVGGGAAICERLCATWRGRRDVELTLLAPGPSVPPGLRSLRVDVLEGRAPSSLGTLAYARFCRRFEKALTQALIRLAPDAVLVHDIAEAPDFQALHRHGIPCVPILHVDVVDFFCRMYLGGRVRPQAAEACMRRLRPWPILPDLLRLVFDKQAAAALCCPHLVVPSQGMAGILEQTYPQMAPGRIVVVPWGAPEKGPSEAALQAARSQWSRRLALPAEAPVILTLSRLSPEKGQDLLLEALAWGEQRGEVPAGLTLVVCGQVAFMQGPAFLERLHRLARNLRRVRVVFPGHLGGAEKRVALERADLFVSASRHESYGLTTMEALAAGTPVLALETPGARQALSPDCGRILAREGDLRARLWGEIRDMLADRERLETMGRAARSRAAAHPFSLAAERLRLLLAGLKRS